MHLKLPPKLKQVIERLASCNLYGGSCVVDEVYDFDPDLGSPESCREDDLEEVAQAVVDAYREAKRKGGKR